MKLRLLAVLSLGLSLLAAGSGSAQTLSLCNSPMSKPHGETGASSGGILTMRIEKVYVNSQ